QSGSDSLVRFDGAIGVDPLTPVNGVDAINIVRGVNPSGRVWTIRRFSASVGRDGSINARAGGLLLASGDVIGTRAGVAQVALTLFCGAANNTATAFNSAPAAMDTEGNFHLTGVLTQDGVNRAVLPQTCDNPALLIRTVGANGAPGVWLAAGIPDPDARD
ncbi:MAG TPA: hypothetical protein VFU71_06690, partial [Burkholderiaceae bacterium]|nr:hypothetical protein [Burkholderiaceae bacterium]